MADHAFDAAGAELVAELTDFTFALRLAGLPVTIERSMSFLRAVAGLDSFDPVQLFWAGRSTLCVEPGDFDIFDDTFNWYFRREVPAAVRRPARPAVRLVPVARDGRTESPVLPAGPAAPAVLRHQDLSELSDAERAELASLLRLLDPPPVRRPGRHTPTPPRGGRSDPHPMLRSVLRGGGEMMAKRRLTGTRPRRLVLLLDVSAMMSPYSDPVLRFAHAAKRRLGPGCEVFGLGAALTRLSEVLTEQDPQRAVAAASVAIPEWSDGTRLGQALQAFLDQHGQRGMARGAVVIVVSNGSVRENATHLAEQARRLSRLTRSLIWVNPQSGENGYAPAHQGLIAVQPFCDHLLAGHSLAGLGELMDIAPDA